MLQINPDAPVEIETKFNGSAKGLEKNTSLMISNSGLNTAVVDLQRKMAGIADAITILMITSLPAKPGNTINENTMPTIDIENDLQNGAPSARITMTFPTEEDQDGPISLTIKTRSDGMVICSSGIAEEYKSRFESRPSEDLNATVARLAQTFIHDDDSVFAKTPLDIQKGLQVMTHPENKAELINYVSSFLNPTDRFGYTHIQRLHGMHV